MMHSTCNSCTFKMFSSIFLVALVFSSVAFGMDFEEGNLEEVPKMEPFDEELSDHDEDALRNENARFNFGYKIQVYDTTRFYFYGIPNILLYATFSKLHTNFAFFQG